MYIYRYTDTKCCKSTAQSSPTLGLSAISARAKAEKAGAKANARGLRGDHLGAGWELYPTEMTA